jgi:hypothetical protein
MFFTGRYLTLVALVAVFGCGDGGPTSPSTPPSAQPIPTPVPVPLPPPARGNGEIAIRSIEPASGASIKVQECVTNGYRWFCADEPRMTFEVVVDRDIPDAALAVTFYVGVQRCGSAFAGSVPLMAGSRTVLRASSLDFSDEERPLACNLPATTTKLVAQIWAPGRPSTLLATREFEAAYSFHTGM